MTLSMYQASIPVFIRHLTNLSALFDKAAAYAETKKIEPAVFAAFRIAPDMFPLSRQVQIATDVVKGCAGRLAGIDAPSYTDDETTFADLKARISKTITFLQSIKASQIDGSEERQVTLKIRGNEIHFKGQDYLLNFVLPNLFFHVTMTYAIMRHNGVEVGKADFLGPST